MQFLASLPTYGGDFAAQSLWAKFSEKLNYLDGIVYYKHPVISSASRSVPDLTILARPYQPLTIRILRYAIEEIDSVADETWVLHGVEGTSPLLDLDDYSIGVKYKFDKYRELRHLFQPISAVAMPQISRIEYEAKLGPFPSGVRVIWSDMEIGDTLVSIGQPIEDRNWRLAKSVFQGINPLNQQSKPEKETSKVIGEAIRILEKDIALLDEEQHKVAIQIAPGPQRIRGLAGTGKTVILALKAANIHLRYPNKRILFTFHTQSLYNQAKTLITKFYRVHSEEDPDWDKIHIRHGWGARDRPGVYSELCGRHGIQPYHLNYARNQRPESPFGWCCQDILNRVEISPYYDFILVDEGQDSPPEFFKMLYALCQSNKQICWAYDELQNLSSVEVPSPKELFGVDEHGNPLISLEGEDYPGGIEKDFILHRSYRCPRNILMLAHGIGLGIHAPRGCVQMLTNKRSWESIGYEVDAGNLSTGEHTVISRNMTNSPNRIKDVYHGDQSNIILKSFDDRSEELSWIATSIKNDIEVEQVLPQQIIIICLDKNNAKQHLAYLQQELNEIGVFSTIPGLVNSASDFAEQGRVTLSTVYRAKGNEAPVIYVLALDYLAQYVEEIETRNRAFTAISRSKGWLRMSGSGSRMKAVVNEVNNIIDDLPYFRYIFPDMTKIRKLDASETSRRRNEAKRVLESVDKLLDINTDALSVLDPETLRKLLKKLEEANDANQ